MLIHSLVFLLSLGTGANEQVLDAFQYAGDSAARAEWVAGKGTPAVDMTNDGGRAVLQLRVPFAEDTGLERTIIDRKVNLDLAVPGEFALELCVARPEAVGQVSVYFHSGKGWFGGGTGLVRQGWQTLRFSKAAFRVEDRPTGWHRIDTIRISFWRGQPENAAVRLGRLTAQWHDVALVIPAGPGARGSENYEARETAELVGDMMAELGLGSDAIEDTALATGALGKHRVAILAYNPNLPAEAVAALVRYVEAGGKVFACYGLPSRLGEALGFGQTHYFRPQRPGGLAEIRFDAASIAGLPKAVRQASWNITTAEPTGHNAQVIGRWYDDKGQATGRAAMLLSDRGAYFSHILLADDRQEKEQLLAAVLGRLSPPLWRDMAQAELDRIGRVGHCGDKAALVEYVKQYASADATERLEAGLKASVLAETLVRDVEPLTPNPSGTSKDGKEGTYVAAVEQARQAHESLVAAYLRAQPSPSKEGRAWWNHSGTGAYPGDWDRSARELAAAGFNMILPNMLWGGLAHYASDVLPRSSTYRERGDQIAQCVAAAKKYGLEVHVWKVDWNLSTAPKEFVAQMRSQGRTQVTSQGEQHDWLCPSHPENFKLELDSLLEVARKYDVDGLHFDYIRYPDSKYCYCDGCRERFQAEAGQKVAQWPKEVLSDPLREPFQEWRRAQITRLVEAVHREAKKVKPGIKISAAVFGGYPQCKESVGQDWAAWVKAGYLDFICPMDYTESDLSFSGLVSNQIKLVGGRIPIYPGIGATASRSALTADRVVGQIHLARSLGVAGFTIFNFHERTAKDILPGVGMGATSKRAVPPHR